MAEPRLKETLRDGGTIKTTRIPMASTHEEVQELIRRDACEMIYIDSQHGPHTEWDVARTCTAAEELGVGVQLRIKHTRYAHLIQGYLGKHVEVCGWSVVARGLLCCPSELAVLFPPVVFDDRAEERDGIRPVSTPRHSLVLAPPGDE